MTDQTILEMTGIRKAFGPVTALDNVDFQVQRGEIHGLLGGNGAGKTTLMNVLFGLYKADAGQIAVKGSPIQIRSPREAIDYGIGMVHQHFLQVNGFNVTENIVLGTPLPNRPTMDLTGAKGKIADLSRRFGLEIDPNAPLEGLPMGARQRVEILKALYRGVELLILDEPTTMLTPQEVDGLFSSLRVMVDSGLSVIFITHKLREVLGVCDRITVLRQGRTVITLDRAGATEEAFIRAMVGDDMQVEKSLLFAQEGLEEAVAALGDRLVLEVRALTVIGEEGQSRLKNCDLQIRAGEILGIAGVAGNGQHALAESLMAIQPPVQGTIHLDGTDITSLGTSDRLQRGIAYVPENRWQDGFLPTANVAQNLILGHHRLAAFSRRGFLNWHTVRQQASRLIGEFNIMTEGPQAVAANLSGGNIQRMMLARAFSQETRLMIVHNPTQGLDIPSIEFVYGKLLARTQAGMAALLISENLDELFLLCNRIAVLFNGEIMGILKRDQFDSYEVGRLMSGVRDG